MTDVQNPVRPVSPPAPAPAPKEDNKRKWILEQTRIDHLPMDHRSEAQAKLNADMAAESKDVKPLSLSMAPDEYVGRLKAEREEALQEEEKAMQERHKAEDEALQARHKSDQDEIADERKQLDNEMKAVRAHVDLWRQRDEQLAADPSRRDAIMRRYDLKGQALANETGYDVRPPTQGDTTIAGFAEQPMPGHPWIRPMGRGLGGRLHPEY